MDLFKQKRSNFLWILLILLLAIMMCSCSDNLEKSIERYQRSLSMNRRLDCDLFCRKTGFRGAVGGCQCGLTLFAFKRSKSHENG